MVSKQIFINLYYILKVVNCIYVCNNILDPIFGCIVEKYNQPQTMQQPIIQPTTFKLSVILVINFSLFTGFHRFMKSIVILSKMLMQIKILNGGLLIMV